MKTQLTTDGQKIVPAEKYGLQVISMGFLTQDDAPIIWRGPMLHGALQQFFREVRWIDLDYLIIDMPPGTGDVALSLSQTVPVAGAIVVTTPQQVSLADSRRAVAMYKKLNIPTLGIIENMSYFVCPSCQHEADIFGSGGGETMATELGVPFLGRIPIYQPIREGGDTRRAADDQRARVAGRTRVHGGRRADGRAGVDRELRAADDSAYRGAMNDSLQQAHARQRTRRAAARGSRLPDRRREPLVSRRVEERAARAHRVRAPVRAPDVRRVAASRQGLLPAAAGRRRAR